MSLSLRLGAAPSGAAVSDRSSFLRRNLPGGERRLAGGVGFARNWEEAERTRIKSWISASAGVSPGANCLSPRRISQGFEMNKRSARIICSASVLDYETLQWISSISCLVLMLARGTAIHKSFLAPLFALQAPSSIISWIRGDYGISTAFIGLLVRLFYHIPGELELPFLTALLVIVTPYQASGLRGTQVGAVISLAIAGYLAFQHFSRVGGIQKAFDQGSIVATLAIMCIIVVPCLCIF